MKPNFFVKNYLLCWKFLKESRWYLVFALGLFALTFLIGFVYPIFFREEIFGFIAKIIGMLEGKTTIELISFIFFNNLRASFMAIILGLLFGLFPLLVTITNGYILGFVSRETAVKEGIFILFRLLPHGIFEIPAIIFSIGIGLKIGTSIFIKKKKEKRLRHNIEEGIRFFIFVVFPLLLIAGIIEGLLISIAG